MKIQYTVNFSGRTVIEFDTDDYPHYFKDNEARGGEPQLAKDIFYDEADFRAFVFVEGATEISENAFFDRVEPDDPSGRI